MTDDRTKELEVPQYERAHFHYGGHNSMDMGLKISADTTYTSPGYDVEFEEVDGRDGDMAVDNKRLLPFIYPIHTFLEPESMSIERAASKVSQWLKEDVRYKPLRLSWDSEYEYSAIFYDQYDIRDLLPRFGKIALNFKCHPIKYHLSGLQKKSFLTGAYLYNPEKRAAKPLIEITGSGNITLKNNGEDWLILTAVDGAITIDSQSMSVYKGDAAAFNKMNAGLKPLFPLLAPGSNELTWTGNVSKIEITPRWEAVV